MVIPSHSPVGGWYAVWATNPVSSQYLRAPNASAIASTDIYWDDPINDMILMANELAFRTTYQTSSEVVGTAVFFADHNCYKLTTEQPYIISPNLTLTSRTVQQEALISSSKGITEYATQRGWLAGG